MLSKTQKSQYIDGIYITYCYREVIWSLMFKYIYNKSDIVFSLESWKQIFSFFTKIFLYLWSLILSFVHVVQDVHWFIITYSPLIHIKLIITYWAWSLMKGLFLLLIILLKKLGNWRESFKIYKTINIRFSV